MCIRVFAPFAGVCGDWVKGGGGVTGGIGKEGQWVKDAPMP